MPNNEKKKKKKRGDDPIYIHDTQVQPIEDQKVKLHDEVRILHDALTFDGQSVAEVNVTGFHVTAVDVCKDEGTAKIGIQPGITFRVAFQPFLGHPLLIVEGSGSSSRVRFYGLPLGTTLDAGSGTKPVRMVRALGRFSTVDVTLTGAPK